MDITTLSIYAYSFLICSIYILFGFILTNCVYDNAKKTYNIITNIQIFATPTPTPKKTTPPAAKCIPAVTNKPKVPFKKGKLKIKTSIEAKNAAAKNAAAKNIAAKNIVAKNIASKIIAKKK